MALSLKKPLQPTSLLADIQSAALAAQQARDFRANAALEKLAVILGEAKYWCGQFEAELSGEPRAAVVKLKQVL